MIFPQKFCTGCGAPVAAGMRYCSQCGQPVSAPVPAAPQGIPHPPNPSTVPPVTAGPGDGERVLGIVPFIEQGLLSVIRYTLVVTDRRLIFCTWDQDTDEAMSDAEDAVMQESCDISGTKDEIARFRAKDWAAGPWQRYRSMAPETIIAGAPGTVVFLLGDIADATIVCETLTSTQDKLMVRNGSQNQAFDLMYSQGPYLAGSCPRSWENASPWRTTSTGAAGSTGCSRGRNTGKAPVKCRGKFF
jgi:hypothetical protein